MPSTGTLLALRLAGAVSAVDSPALQYRPPHTLRYLRYPAAAADDDDDDALPSLPLIHGVSLVVSRPTARPSGLSPPPFTRTRTRTRIERHDQAQAVMRFDAPSPYH